MGWISNLFDRLSGQLPQVPAVDHPELGRIRPSHRPRQSAWLWETLDPVAHRRGPVTVTWLAGEEGPSQAQVDFGRWLRDNIDDVVEQARPVLAIDVQDWTDKPMPAKAWDELFWEAAGLPDDGKRDSEWDVSFATRTCPDVMLTVTFRDGKPLFVTADD